MPFDGVVVKCVALELKKELVGGRIEKIYQPQRDEIILNVRSNSGQRKLLLSANPSNPRIHFTTAAGSNPEKPPMFCMLLRKYITGGIFRDIVFYDYERMLDLQIECMNEMGDLVVKRLIIEIMGRYSNIILINEKGFIIDCARHVDIEMSRVREIMPGREYTLPPAQDKASADNLDIPDLINKIRESRSKTDKLLLENIKGFSPLLCRLICQEAGIDDNSSASALSEIELQSLKKAISQTIDKIVSNSFKPYLIFTDAGSMESGAPFDFHCIAFKDFGYIKYLDSISEVLDLFYSTKDLAAKLDQKKAAILKKLNTSLQRCERKAFLQQSDVESSKNMDQLKLYGELLTANMHIIPERSSNVRLQNYYDEQGGYVDIPLDMNLSPNKNAQAYYKKYSRAKSTFTHASANLKTTRDEISYLESLIYQVESCDTLSELSEINDELASAGYVAASKGKHSSRRDEPSMPLHFVSSDRIDIYAGRNNRQNDLLTFKHASKEDIWMHAKNIPGSHVIIHGKGKIPDRTIAEAAELTAYHSKYRLSSNVPVDITKVKDVRKPKGFKPGLVLYDNFRTVYVTPREETVNRLKAK